LTSEDITTSVSVGNPDLRRVIQNSV
jgi:hypothetical protein